MISEDVLLRRQSFGSLLSSSPFRFYYCRIFFALPRGDDQKPGNVRGQDGDGSADRLSCIVVRCLHPPPDLPPAEGGFF